MTSPDYYALSERPQAEPTQPHLSGVTPSAPLVPFFRVRPSCIVSTSFAWRILWSVSSGRYFCLPGAYPSNYTLLERLQAEPTQPHLSGVTLSAPLVPFFQVRPSRELLVLALIG